MPHRSTKKEPLKTIYTNAKIYTVEGADWDKHPQEAVAVDAAGKIAFVGTAEDARKRAAAQTEVIDLAGKVILPGFIDSHCHPPGLSLIQLYAIPLHDTRTKEATLRRVTEYVRDHPDWDVYFGSGFLLGIGDDPRGPKREWLDAIESEKPVVLNSHDGHNYWMNTKAFERMGITPDTPVPTGGSIKIDEATGALWGVVTDCMNLITLKQEYTEAQKMTALEHFQASMLRWGYSGAMLISPYFVEDELLARFDRAGDLKLRANLSTVLYHDDRMENALVRIEELKELFQGSKNARISTMKFFVDGVVEGMTAYLKEPYATNAQAGREADYCSELCWEETLLAEYFDRALKAGLQIHVHSIGDAATEKTLDAIGLAQQGNPDLPARNVITHLQLVQDADIDRMKELNVIASFQPFWHFREPNWFEVMDLITLGEDRALAAYPVGRCARRGIPITFSGDFPVSHENNPFWAMETAVTRNLNNAENYSVPDITDIDDPTWLRNPNERISVKEAVEAYTINGAYQLFREHEIGSLAGGKEADFVVLDADPLLANALDIDKTKVLATVIGGELAYGTFSQI